MHQLMLILTEEVKRLPTVRELEARGFLVSAAVDRSNKDIKGNGKEMCGKHSDTDRQNDKGDENE